MILGSLSVSFTSRLMRVTMAAGVPLGTARPNHALASKPGTVSATVGTSGNWVARFAVVTASARSSPLRM